MAKKQFLKLRRLAEDQDITTDELAAKAGIVPRTLRHMELGRDRRHLPRASHPAGADRGVFLPEGRERSMNMKAKLYINSEESIIRIEGGTNEVLNLLVDAIAQILEGYFPHNFEKQMAWVSGLLYGTIRALDKEDNDED